jgi:hypothetical protein
MRAKTFLLGEVVCLKAGGSRPLYFPKRNYRTTAR